MEILLFLPAALGVLVALFAVVMVVRVVRRNSRAAQRHLREAGRQRGNSWPHTGLYTGSHTHHHHGSAGDTWHDHSSGDSGSSWDDGGSSWGDSGSSDSGSSGSSDSGGSSSDSGSSGSSY
jgi:hypothetical protein